MDAVVVMAEGPPVGYCHSVEAPLLHATVVAFAGGLEASSVRRNAAKRLVALHGGTLSYMLSKRVRSPPAVALCFECTLQYCGWPL